jgi:hypothetical protein
MIGIRVASDNLSFTADALGRAITLLAFGVITVDLYQRGVINIAPERALYSAEVDCQAITGS